MEYEEIGKAIPSTMPKGVGAIKHVRPQHIKGGPWKTSSGGMLNVMFSFPLGFVQHYLLAGHSDFFQYDRVEIERIMPHEIRGFRCHEVSGINQDCSGGDEFHRIRKEILLCLEGAVQMEFYDVFAKKRVLHLHQGEGCYMLPFMLHSYQGTEPSNRLVVLANTLFDPAQKIMHDSYSAEDFQHLVDHFKQPARR
ncbi:MAG: WxcM-like domain-containing protein [archaeon]